MITVLCEGISLKVRKNPIGCRPKNIIRGETLARQQSRRWEKSSPIHIKSLFLPSLSLSSLRKKVAQPGESSSSSRRETLEGFTDFYVANAIHSSSQGHPPVESHAPLFLSPSSSFSFSTLFVGNRRTGFRTEILV